jgi:lamin tail-like protein
MHRTRLLVALVFAALLLAAPAAPASSSGVVVSQVYAGGGNSGASFTNDFVELFNAGQASVSIDGWTVQYASAAGTSWQTTPLAGSIAPGGYYLVQLASAAAVGSPLPTPDAIGTSNMAQSGGKVAVVTNATALGCGASAGSCSGVAGIEDFVGYGSAADYEGGSGAGVLTSSTAAVRGNGGCTDTDSNSADFTVDTPTPRNSAASPNSCGGGGGGGGGAGTSATASVDIDVQGVLALSLEQSAINFGNAFSGSTPPAVPERVTVASNNAGGYSLAVRRSAFMPADLPLGLTASAPPGGSLNPVFGGGARVAVPIAPASDLLIGTTAAPSASGGDSWPTTVGFTGPLPVVAPGHYSATLTYTLIGR